MSKELAALDRTCTWDRVPLSSHAVPIKSKWVFKIKTMSDGSIERCAWFDLFVSMLRVAGFTPSDYDPALFIHLALCGRTLLLLHVG